MGLTQAEALALLTSTTKVTPTPKPQSTLPSWRSDRNTKHVTWHDEEMRCTERRCNSPTYIRVIGMPKCQTHAILQLSRMLDPKEILEGEL